MYYSMIHVENLTFGYSSKKILYSRLNLTLETGSIYGLLGKNGAGKSTLLKALIGTLYPLSGHISVNNFYPADRKPSFLETIYFIPEEVSVPRLSARNYLDLYAGFYPQFDENLFYKSLQLLEVGTDRKLNTLSFGQQKKFAIAFGIACNTRVLIMDEPTNGMDIPSKAQFRRLVSMVFSQEKLLLISTHQVKDLENMIDRVIIVDEGKLLLHHSLGDIVSRLCFTSIARMPQDDSDILYAEPSLQGIAVVIPNSEGLDSKINLEQLFQAVTAKPDMIQSIFSD